MTAELPKKVGWVGLGLMGLPMATNLLQKMDSSTEFYVYDVMPMDEFVKRGEGRVKACGSSKEVADKSVCHASSSLKHPRSQAHVKASEKAC